MKICLINSLYHPFTRGGAEKVCQQMAQNLRDKGHQVFIVSAKPKKITVEANGTEKIYYLHSNYLNLAKHSIFYRLFWHFFNLFSFSNYRKLKAILEAEQPDLVISHNLMGVGFYTIRALNTSKVNYHHFLHDIQLLHPSGLLIYDKEKQLKYLVTKLYRLLLKKILIKPDLVISPSQWLLKLHQDYGYFKQVETKIESLGKYFPLSETNVKLTSLDLFSGQDYFLFAGQLESHKGIEFLLDTFLYHNPKHYNLAIAGKGQLEAKLKKQAKDSTNIHFLGHLDQEKLNQAILYSQALIVPSLCYENSPLIITEAKGLAKPVIGSNLGGIAEASPNQELLFTPLSQDDLSKKLDLVANKKGL